MIKRPYGKINKGHTIPYGTLVGASTELLRAYYAHGYLRDEDMPELPCVPLEGEHVDPIEELYKKELMVVAKEVLETLTPRAIKVLQMRFGIDMTQDYTLEEVGLAFDLSRERIRQIEAKALRHMKHPLRSGKLRELFGYYVTTAEKKAEIEAKQRQWGYRR
jgi:RNA polymerase sigma factor (sigma-70 family)